jgi:hypothetical protein
LNSWIRQQINATNLYAEITSIDVVAKEKIPRISGTAADFEEFHEIILSQGELNPFERKHTAENIHIVHEYHRKLRNRWASVTARLL